MVEADDDYGYVIEEEVRQIAARLGVADFVYTVPQLKKGDGSREVGDALLVAGERGAILQVKSRQPGTRDDAESWLKRRGERAYRQGEGSRRTIAARRATGACVEAFPVRCATWSDEDRVAAGLMLDFDVSQWPIVIIVDHPGADGLLPPVAKAFWITTDDWLNLNAALRSISGLLVYIERVLEAGEELEHPLGSESERFRRLAGADADYAAAGGPRSKPWLSDDALRDPVGVQLFRELLERIWPPDASTPHVPLESLRRVLEFLDSVPPGMQSGIGRWILRKRGALHSGQNWSSGAVLIDKRRLLVFACATVDTVNFPDLDHFDADVASLAAVRADEARRQESAIECSLAVGQLVDNEGIDYRYIYTEPPLAVTPELRRSVMHRFGRLDLAAGSSVAIEAGRNERCPCGSGLKFKHCEAGLPLHATKAASLQ